MKLSPIPDLGSRRQLAITAIAVWLIVSFTLMLSGGPRVARTLGDTDDALRLTMVRDLASGRGWFDQKLIRLQPPLGTYMHWSRLVDGGEASLLKLFALFLPAGQAETAMRMTWPLLWILPAVTAVLLVARRLGGGPAVVLSAVSVSLSISTSGQFQPGRIDHHNVQITCCLLAVAAAVQRPAVWWAAACGLASALGLAVGLEALPFLALIGVAVSLCWVWGRSPDRSAMAYGAALAFGAVTLHMLQTPPWRWTLAACDALAFNLVGGLCAAGIGLVVAVLVASRRGVVVRLALLSAVGVLAGAVYLGLDPLCVGGPMAGIDPELKRVWLVDVGEMAPWPRLLAADPRTAISLALPVATGLLGWLWLGRRREMRVNPSWMLAGALLIASALAGLQASRSAEYAVWFFAPVAGAALADFGAAFLANRMIPTAVLVLAVNVLPGWAIARIDGWRSSHLGASANTGAGPAGRDRCTETAAYARLSQLAPGLVLSEIDAGPYILANSPDSAVEAPYHRMTWGIKQARGALGAAPPEAERRIRALHVAYVLNCAAHAMQSDRASLSADSLQKALDQGRSPDWLQPLSGAGEPLQIYRVR